MFCGTGVYTSFALRAETRNYQNRYFHAENRFLNSAEKQKSRSCLLTGKPRFFRIMSVNTTLFFDSFGQRSNTLDFAGRKIVCQRGIANKPDCLSNRFFAFSVPLLDYPRRLKSKKSLFLISIGNWGGVITF